LSELLAIPRQRLDHLGAALPRGLKANTHAHHRRFSHLSAGLTLKVLRGQVAQANHRLTVSGERIRLSARALLRNRRDRFAGLEVRLKASNSPTPRRSATPSRASANARNGWPSAPAARF
jgi:exodeoxyribonuclease VII large subunit